MIHIADTKMARRYGDFFIRQINKIEDVSSVEDHLLIGNIISSSTKYLRIVLRQFAIIKKFSFLRIVQLRYIWVKNIFFISRFMNLNKFVSV